MKKVTKWTKKIDSIHLIADVESTTLCGKPLLGNNYMLSDTYKELDRELGHERGICPNCVEKLLSTFKL